MPIPVDRWNDWWAGAYGRVIKAYKRKRKTLYDMGQNFNLLIELKLKRKDINWLEIPGGENCSSFGASIDACGFEAVDWPPLFPFLDMEHIHETADVVPGHYGMTPHYRRLEPNEPIRAGCKILSMHWHEPNTSVNELLLEALTWFALLKSPFRFITKIWKRSPNWFRDGIMVTQRDEMRIPDPYWRATHLKTVWRNDRGVLSIVEQSTFFKQSSIHQDALYADMSGEKPRYIVMEPLFLYG